MKKYKYIKLYLRGFSVFFFFFLILSAGHKAIKCFCLHFSGRPQFCLGHTEHHGLLCAVCCCHPISSPWPIVLLLACWDHWDQPPGQSWSHSPTQPSQTSAKTQYSQSSTTWPCRSWTRAQVWPYSALLLLLRSSSQ